MSLAKALQITKETIDGDGNVASPVTSEDDDTDSGSHGDNDKQKHNLQTALHTNDQESLTIVAAASRRNAFQSRLRTFQLSTYPAKPACLSPIVCAQFGWENVEKDMLNCVSCQAVVSVSLPLGFSFRAMEKICKAYRKELAEAHKDECKFRLSAQRFMLSKEKHDTKNATKIVATKDFTDETSGIPDVFASTLAEEVLEIMEDPTPSHLLYERVRCLQRNIVDSHQIKPPPESLRILANLQVPDQLQNFMKNNALSNGGNETILSELLDELVKSSHSDNDDGRLLSLILLGWKTTEKKKNFLSSPESKNMIVLDCPLCLASMEITPYKHDDATTHDEPDTKRRKVLAKHCNPHDAHRHYCPYRCGFPSSVLEEGKPLWRLLLERVYNESKKSKSRNDASEYKDADGELLTRTSRILGILRSSIFPKKVEL